MQEDEVKSVWHSDGTRAFDYLGKHWLCAKCGNLARAVNWTLECRFCQSSIDLHGKYTVHSDPLTTPTLDLAIEETIRAVEGVIQSMTLVQSLDRPDLYRLEKLRVAHKRLVEAVDRKVNNEQSLVK